MLVKDVSIPSGSSLELLSGGKVVLETGDKIQIDCSVADKVSLTALNIDGGSDIGADLTTSDLIIVDDGASGTNKKAALSRVVTLMSAQGFVTDDPTALAIALG
jgi:hypothetical protein